MMEVVSAHGASERVRGEAGVSSADAIIFLIGADSRLNPVCQGAASPRVSAHLFA
jgi:Trk K+ transport system NAD-binding subunit